MGRGEGVAGGEGTLAADGERSSQPEAQQGVWQHANRRWVRLVRYRLVILPCAVCCRY